MLGEGSKPCWACRKGRLICDFTKPACKKCQTRGTECPGYDAKPLVWIPNGTVKSKRRKNDKTQPAAESKKQPEPEKKAEQAELKKQNVPEKKESKQVEPQDLEAASETSNAMIEQPARLLAKRVKLKADLVILSYEVVEYRKYMQSPYSLSAACSVASPMITRLLTFFPIYLSQCQDFS